MAEIVIVGTGGLAREVLQVLLDLNEAGSSWSVLGWVDDNTEVHRTEVHGLEVLGGIDWLRGKDGLNVVVPVGSPHVRRKIVERIDALGSFSFPVLVHPRAWVGRQVQFGNGTIVCPGTMITTDIEIGEHVIINLDCTVGHDTRIGDFVTVAPSVNVSGNVDVGDGCDLGTGSTIIQGIEIGEWSIVGAGAVVVKPVPANVTAVGMPAKAIKEREAGWHLQ
jgi:sugar O-acyltransferase (sialic acid O-acetyltransferase NeuD family)